ncbi:hypothetical protein BGZ76_002856, partial [Entomortierella beljakovae]
DNIISQWSADIPSFNKKQKVAHHEILDISQNDHLDGLGSLIDKIIEGIFKTSPGKRQIPIEVMYQGDGANLYASYSSNSDYYLNSAEHWILQTFAAEIVSLIADRSRIIELGAGSLEKTQVLLQALAHAPQIVHGVEYFALDINRQALVESLATLPALEKIKYHGLFGTYNDGLQFVASMPQPRDVEQGSHVFLWLGSGIENMTVESAIGMVKSIADIMVEGDMILIGMDGWASDMSINAAYEPADKLVLNTLRNANEILEQDVFDMNHFAFSTHVNRLEGRNECCCMAAADIELSYEGETVQMEKGERILVVPSYKYTNNQVIDMVNATGCLEVVQRFGTPEDGEVQYGIWMWRKIAHQ